MRWYKKMDGKKILDYLAGFVLAALMSFSLVYPLTTTLGFPYSSFRILGLVIFILFIYSVLFANRNVSRISVPLAIISMAAGIVFLAVKKDLAYIIQPFSGLLNIFMTKPYFRTITILFYYRDFSAVAYTACIIFTMKNSIL